MIKVTNRNYNKLFQTEPYIPTIGVDIDGVLNHYTGKWYGYEVWYIPLKDAGNFLQGIKEKGYRVCIMTARRDLDHAIKWLELHKLDVHIDLITNQKVPCKAYIDDRNICFRGDVKQTLEDIDNFSPWWQSSVNQDSLGK